MGACVMSARWPPPGLQLLSVVLDRRESVSGLSSVDGGEERTDDRKAALSVLDHLLTSPNPPRLI